MSLLKNCPGMIVVWNVLREPIHVASHCEVVAVVFCCMSSTLGDQTVSQ